MSVAIRCSLSCWLLSDQWRPLLKLKSKNSPVWRLQNRLVKKKTNLLKLFNKLNCKILFKLTQQNVRGKNLCCSRADRLPRLFRSSGCLLTTRANTYWLVFKIDPSLSKTKYIVLENIEFTAVSMSESLLHLTSHFPLEMRFAVFQLN